MKLKLFPMILFLLLLTQFSLGQIPQTINYQGVLTQPSGDPIPNGSYDITFRIYDADIGGTVLWNETQQVTVENGIFNVILGSATSFTLDFDAPYWLSIQVDPDPELTPRIELTGVPYSISSVSTEGIQHRPVDPGSPLNGQVLKWDGSSWAPADDNAGTSVWATSGNHIYNTNSGNVGISTTNPLRQLSVGQTQNGIYSSGHDFIVEQGMNSANVLALQSVGDIWLNIDFNNNNPETSQLVVAKNDTTTGATPLVTIRESGNVGIGTTTPIQKLEVVDTRSSSTSSHLLGLSSRSTNSDGDARLNFTLRNGAGIDRVGEIIAYKTENDGLNYLFRTTNNDGQVVDALRILKNGAIGIGTASPYTFSKLHVKGTDQTFITVESPSNHAAAFEWRQNSTQKWVAYVPSNDDDLHFSTGSDKVVFKNNGNVGIGTTSPQGKLDVNGTIYQRGTLLHADYVFEPGYKLETIREHAEFMWQYKHLKAIPKARVDDQGREIVEVGAHRKGIVEELEKAHIYIAELEKRLARLEAYLDENK